jgi:Domain of unknown function (DUF6265)
MKKRIIILSYFLMASLFSCQKKDKNGNVIIFEELYKAEWILGEWQQKDSLGTLKEIWMPLNDSTYVGQSYYIVNNKDTVHRETIELTQNQSNLLYITATKGEKNDEDISFQLTKDEDSLLVFENPKNLYPKKISYSRKKDASLLVSVSGITNAKTKVDNYKFVKQK